MEGGGWRRGNNTTHAARVRLSRDNQCLLPSKKGLNTQRPTRWITPESRVHDEHNQQFTIYPLPSLASQRDNSAFFEDTCPLPFSAYASGHESRCVSARKVVKPACVHDREYFNGLDHLFDYPVLPPLVSWRTFDGETFVSRKKTNF